MLDNFSEIEKELERKLPFQRTQVIMDRMLVEMDSKDHCNEISDGKEEQVIGKWGKGNPC